MKSSPTMANLAKYITEFQTGSMKKKFLEQTQLPGSRQMADILLLLGLMTPKCEKLFTMFTAKETPKKICSTLKKFT